MLLPAAMRLSVLKELPGDNMGGVGIALDAAAAAAAAAATAACCGEFELL